MREARIILPRRDNNGVSSHVEIAKIERELLTTFGGFTRQVGTGAWIAPNGETIMEEVYIYDVAMESGGAQELRLIARKACRLLRQACIYVRFPNGEVSFVPKGDADDK